MQLKQLKTIVKYAYDNVPLYHRKFSSLGVGPDDVKTLADLRKLPITTKQELQSSSLGDIISPRVNFNQCVKRKTSGSTGFPLAVYVNPAAADLESAIWARTYLEDGLRLRDKLAIMADPRGFPGGKVSYHNTRLLSRKYLSLFDSVETQLSILEKYGPDIIKGYPSSLVMLSDKYCEDKWAFKPRLMLTSAELLDKQSRNAIKSMCKLDLLDNYACTEFSLLAWECLTHNGYHMNVDNAVIEFIDDKGDDVFPGETGEIICSSLNNLAMPLIRYKTDDVGIPLTESCSCGRSLPLMKMVEGRTDDFLVTTSGQKIPPTVFFPYPFVNTEGIKQFKVIQNAKKEITMQIVEWENMSNKTEILKKAREKIQNVFGEDMQVSFEFLDCIPKDSNGKLRKVVSLI